jgi:hypothetical protein
MLAALFLVTGFVCVVSITYAIHSSKDPFHPGIVLGCLSLFLYAWIPWQLLSGRGLTDFLDESTLVSIQLKNLLGIIGLLGGCLWSPPPRWKTYSSVPEQSRTKTLRAAALICGAAGLVGYLDTILSVGGFRSAYGTGYGGGWDDNGYIRDATILSFSSVLLLIFSSFGRRTLRKDILLLVLFSSPWLIQGILGAKRGPTFMLAVFFSLSWYFSRRSRPAPGAAAIGGVCIGFLMLFLVANRAHIYIGSDENLTTDALGGVTNAEEGNEYLYGAGAIVSTQTTGRYFWGRRYFAQVFVRPIPRGVWPTKYADVGLPELEQNAGTRANMKEVVGWGSDGAAPGIVADLWLEFAWLYVPVICLIGGAYQAVWRRAVTAGGVWAAQYVILFALSIYLVMQTMEAVMFRFLELSFPIWIAWHLQAKRRRSAPSTPLAARTA